MMAKSTAEFPVSYVYAHQMLALGATLPAIGCIVVAVRFYIRKMQKLNVSTDDWLILGALMMLIGMGACVIAGVKKHVMGYPTPPPPPLSPSELETYVAPALRTLQQIEYPFQMMMLASYGLTKLSIIFFCRRLFVVGKAGLMNLVTIGAIVVVVLWSIILLGLFIFGCGSNFKAHWGSIAEVEKSCKMPFTLEEGMASSDLILDVFVFFLPFPMIWKLQMVTTRKIAVSSVFAVGAAAIAASVVRLTIYVEILTKTLEGVPYDEDLGVSLMHYWSLLEAGLALIAACMPSLSALFAKRSLGSVLQSVRSVFSLHSLRTNDSNDTQNTVDVNRAKHQKYRVIQDDKGTSSHGYMVSKPNIAYESFVLADLERGPRENSADVGIHVKNVISQEETFPDGYTPNYEYDGNHNNKS